MKRWKGFVVVWALFFIVLGLTGSLNHKDVSITGDAISPITGILKDDPGQVFQTQEYDIRFGVKEKLVYKLRDLAFWVDFVPKEQLVSSVEISYFVMNSNGKIIYFDNERDSISGKTRIERDFDKRSVQELELPAGEYTLGVTVSYGNKDKTFSEKIKLEKISEVLYSLKQLFDIKLELDSKLLDKSNELSARVVFENFGGENTPVNLTFLIYDISDKELYRKEISRTVGTEDSVLQKFEDFKVPAGRYKLVLRTLYNVGVEDYFEQEFVVKDKIDILPFLIMGILFLVGGYFIIRGRMKDKK